jgi:hypothetical protein
MDGSGIDFVIIPLIVLPCLVVWLGAMFYASDHPEWRGSPYARQPQEIATTPTQVVIPGQRTAEVESPVEHGTRP